VPTPFDGLRLSVGRILAMALLASIVLLVLPAAESVAAKRSVRSQATGDSVESEVLRRINAIRADAGLSTLRADPDLVQAAKAHSDEMIAAGMFSHDSPDGKPCDQRIRSYARGRTVGETISWLAGTPVSRQAERTVTLWMNSPPHRATLLSGAFRRIGISREGGQMFGRTGVAFTADLAG
jgi:uncharacterized protein YkwD